MNKELKSLIETTEEFIKLHEDLITQRKKLCYYDIINIIRLASKNIKEIQSGITGIEFGMGQWDFKCEAIWILPEDMYESCTTEEDKLPKKVKAHYLSWALKGHSDKYYLEGFSSNESLEVIAYLLNYLEKKIGFYTTEIVF